MSGAVGSKPALTRNGFPVFCALFSFSSNSSSRMISTAPLRMCSSCSSMGMVLKSVIVCRLVTQRLWVYDHTSTLNLAAARKDQIDSFRIDPVFFFKDPGGKRLNRVVTQYGYRRLQNDGSTIQGIIDEVDRAATELCTIFQGLPLRLRSGKRRQQRWMNVQNTVWKCVQKDGSHNSHEAGENDQ